MQLSSWNNCLAELDTALNMGGPFSASTIADMVFVDEVGSFEMQDAVWQWNHFILSGLI